MSTPETLSTQPLPKTPRSLSTRPSPPHCSGTDPDTLLRVLNEDFPPEGALDPNDQTPLEHYLTATARTILQGALLSN